MLSTQKTLFVHSKTLAGFKVCFIRRGVVSTLLQYKTILECILSKRHKQKLLPFSYHARKNLTRVRQLFVGDGMLIHQNLNNDKRNQFNGVSGALVFILLLVSFLG